MCRIMDAEALERSTDIGLSLQHDHVANVGVYEKNIKAALQPHAGTQVDAETLAKVLFQGFIQAEREANFPADKRPDRAKKVFHASMYHVVTHTSDANNRKVWGHILDLLNSTS